MVDVLLGVGAGRSQYQALQKLVYKLLLLYLINLEYAVCTRKLKKRGLGTIWEDYWEKVSEKT
jgi:hypothetical protein